MRDLGLVSFAEPVKRLLTQGMVTNRVDGTDEWKAMSKSLGNGVDPDEMIEAFGADAARLFILFAAPVENELRWNETGIEGAVRFLRKVYTMVWRWHERLRGEFKNEPSAEDFTAYANTLRHETHRAIVRVTRDYERLNFNTCVSSLMELANALSTFETSFILADEFSFREYKEMSQPPEARTTAEAARYGDLYALKESLEAMTIMLAPVAPHISEEMWEELGHLGGLIGGGAHWPKANDDLAQKKKLEIPVQVNGKVRGRVIVSHEATEDELARSAWLDTRVARWLEGGKIEKIKVVPQRLISIVVKPGPHTPVGFDKTAFREVITNSLATLPALVRDRNKSLEIRQTEAIRHLLTELKAFIGSDDEILIQTTQPALEHLKLRVILYCFHHSTTYFQAEPLVDEYLSRAIDSTGVSDPLSS
jgi:leucyl-tRNA synthetase